MRPDLKVPTPEVLSRFAAIVGDKGALTAREDTEPYLNEWRGLYHGRTPLVLRPQTVSEVSAILKLAHEERIALVPQGGNTGLVGGQIPFESGGEVVLSLNRMKAIRAVDPAGNTLTAEAGATLQSVQEAATAADRLFPLSLASEGTCEIGGNIATNAGGVHVLRYGNTRDLVLGLETVFPGGHVWNGLKTLRKDNTGYDLKSLLVGSEGTLGVITAATLKLFPRPAEVATVFAGLPSLESTASLFSSAFAKAGPLLTAFELIPRVLLDFLPHASPATPRSAGWTLSLVCAAGSLLSIGGWPRRACGPVHSGRRCRERHRRGCRRCSLSGTGQSVLGPAGSGIRGAEIRRRQHQARRVGAGLRNSALHRGGERSRDRAHSRRSPGSFRPLWRRQYSLQHIAAEGRG